MDALSANILGFIQRHELLEPGQAALVGLSGGPDSVALTLVLHELSSSGALPLTLKLAHLNHGLRGRESDGDEAFCVELAARLGLPLRTGRISVREERARGESIETAGRRVRYRFLARAARSEGATAIAVAHHADDVAETVLMRLLRGCGVRGLGAMAPAREADSGGGLRIVRPLLEAGRAELLALLERRGQNWRDDRTNRDKRFLRNRIRHELLPALEGSCGLTAETLCALNRAAVGLSAALDEMLDGEWGSLCTESGAASVGLDAALYERLPSALRKLAMRRAVSLLLGGEEPPALAREHYDAADVLAGKDVGHALTLPGGFLAVREHGVIHISRPRATGERAAIELATSGTTPVPWAGVKIEAALLAGPQNLHELIKRAGPREVFLASDALALPLEARPRRRGDRLRPLGAPGTRKLKDYFIDRKVPRHERERTALVVDAEGRIVWVVGHTIAEPFKLRGGEKRVLHLRAT